MLQLRKLANIPFRRGLIGEIRGCLRRVTSRIADLGLTLISNNLFVMEG